MPVGFRGPKPRPRLKDATRSISGKVLSFKDMGFKKVGLPEELQELLDQLSQRTLSFLRAVVEEAMQQGEIPKEPDSSTLTFALWGVIEGALYIHKRGYLDQAGVSLEGLLETQLRILWQGLKADRGEVRP